MKTCTRCGWTGELDGFHRNANSSDGHVGWCKPCVRVNSRNWRLDHLEQRRAQEKAYDRTPHGRASDHARRDRNNAKWPERKLAREAVMRAIKSGQLRRQPCEVCGTSERVHAHHDDYARQLEVRWLCHQHHCEHHEREMAAARTR